MMMLFERRRADKIEWEKVSAQHLIKALTGNYEDVGLAIDAMIDGMEVDTPFATYRVMHHCLPRKYSIDDLIKAQERLEGILVAIDSVPYEAGPPVALYSSLATASEELQEISKEFFGSITTALSSPGIGGQDA